MTNVPPPKVGFVTGLVRAPRQSEQRWVDEGRTRIYTWDRLHGEFEVFDSRGNHLGSADADGKLVKPAVKGRTIDV
jgi:hypothetical protein